MTNDELIKHLHENRDKILQHVSTIEGDIAQISDKLFPKDVNARNVFMFENKIKTIAAFYKTILDYRKQYEDSIISEIKINTETEKKNLKDDSFMVKLVETLLEKSTRNSANDIILPEDDIQFEEDVILKNDKPGNN